ncbi:UNVERIFIED_CONTAM: hypothetical protein HDU68_006778, partial [Siphonaria sp. JEL0065]
VATPAKSPPIVLEAIDNVDYGNTTAVPDNEKHPAVVARSTWTVGELIHAPGGFIPATRNLTAHNIRQIKYQHSIIQNKLHTIL